MQFIDLKAQYAALKTDIDGAIQRVLDHGQYIMGPEVAEMEAALASLGGARHCIAVASGTEALLISLMALGIGRGDEVITTAFTFAATAEVIVLLGAVPVFVDIERDTGNIDAGLVEAAITTRTRAIMPVGLYGQPSDMATLQDIAGRHGLALIDDAAQAFGSTFAGRPTGSLATLTCTSFFPSKPLGCYGDGGAIFTDDEALATACREIRVHGQSRRYHHSRIGVGGRMDTLQCAVVLAKLPRFEWEIERRLAIGARYNQLLDQAGIARVVQRPGRTSVFAQYTVLVEQRERVADTLKAAGIPTAVHYPVPLNRQPAFAELCRGRATPNADWAAAQVLSLPMHPDLTEAEQDFVVNQLSGAVRTAQ
jgi:UDP-2-acetamido-2-deoxy-ribo-hexuluronate aminotransferase